MGHVVVVVLEGMDAAHEARKNMRELEKAGRLSLDDAAVLYKDAEGKVHVKNEADAPVVGGALIGGFLGLILAFMFPIAGIAIGAIGGALVGKSLDRGVDKKFVKEVSEALTPGNSALFLMISGADPEAAIMALEPFKGTIYQTSISTEAEESLRRVLKD